MKEESKMVISKDNYGVNIRKMEAAQNYPHVEVNISRYALKESLVQARVILYKFDACDCVVILDKNACKSYLKAEEVRENYLRETRYDKYIVNPGVEKQELEKAKVKSLTR